MSKCFLKPHFYCDVLIYKYIMHSDLLYSEIYISNDCTHLERSIAAILQNSAMPWAWK